MREVECYSHRAPMGVAEVTAECSAHHRLNRASLVALAPTASDGHRAHLVLAAGSGDALGLPVLVQRRRAGAIATAHLLALAEPLVCHAVRSFRASRFLATGVASHEDFVSVARAAVTQGLWAYRPESGSGAGYLRLWIDEFLKREAAAVAAPVTVPVRAYRRFCIIAAVRARLAEQCGHPPTDAEILADHDAAFTQRDLDDERATNQQRWWASPADLLGDRLVDESARRELDEIEYAIDPLAGWKTALSTLDLKKNEVEIVARHVGLPPYEHLGDRDRSERVIAAHLGITRSAVRKVLRTVRGLRTPGGPFHQTLRHMSADDREWLGLQPFVHLLDAAA